MMKRYLLLFIAVLAFPVLAYGQGVTKASMRGTVTDAAGEALPGANVLAVHTPTGSEYGTATNIDGSFNLRNMRVGGPYRVRITFVGFQPYVRQDISLSLGEVEVLNVTLEESAAELEEVEVVAAGGLFDSERNGVATSIDERAVERIPTVGRDLADYTRLTPQAYVENDDDDGPAISINGQNNRYNSIYIDGAINNDVFGLSAQGTNGGQTGATPISIDAIEEFQINVSPFDVTQAGFTGGAINILTRSGTNQFTGSAYYYLRNESLAGNTPGVLVDLGEADESLPEFSNNRYGFRLGGPIVRDKLFFFVNGELLRSETPQPAALASFRGNTENFDRIQSVLQEELDYDTGSFGDKAATLDDDKFFARIDANLSQNHKLSARYSYSESDNRDEFRTSPSTANSVDRTEVFPNSTQFATVELNSTFSNRFANSLTLGYTRVRDDRNFARRPFPTVNIEDGDADIQLGPEPFSTANVLDQDIYTLTNNFNWFLGKHTLTIGTHNEFYSISNLFIPYNFGWYFYDSVDDFVNDVRAVNDPNVDFVGPGFFQRGVSLVGDGIGDNADNVGAFDAVQYGIYAQDEFQYNDQLRLTLGIRLDIPQILDEPRFAPDVFDTTLPAIEAAGFDLNGARPGEAPDAQIYVSPRLGVNYDVFGDRTTQIRGGTGLFLGRVPFVWPGGMFLNNGANTGIFDGSALPDGSPIPFRPDPENGLTLEDFGRSAEDVIPSGRLEIFEEDFRYPRVWKTSLGFDQQLPYGFVGTLEGNYTKNLDNIVVTNVNLNPAALTTLNGPDNRPIYGDLNDDGRVSSSDYYIDDRYSNIHRVGTTSEGYTFDITAQVQRQTENLFTSLAYTYGDAYSVNDGTSSQINSVWRFTENVNTANDTGLERSDFSLGHRVLAGASYRAEFLNNLATTVSLFYVGESGRPFSYTIGNSRRMVNEGGRDVALFYVPNDASELTFTGDAAEQQAQALDAFIDGNEYLSDRRGQYAERNGDRTPFEHIFDVKLAQEVFTNIGARRARAEVTLNIFNVGNLINSDWGVRYNTASFGQYDVVRFEGFQDVANDDYTPVYSYVGGDFDDEEEVFDTFAKDSGTYSSRWQVQLGFRVTF
jgi:outer membrane receptor for ferrienterochelin and colicin